MSRTVALIVGGVAAVGTAIGAAFASKKTTDAVKNAVAGLDRRGTPVLPPGAGVTVPVRVTGYWPFTAREDEKKMEGGIFDRMMPAAYKNQPDSPQYQAHVLHTLEDFQAGKAPFVSVSADWTIFPYGQRVSIAEWPGVVFRIVDTGRHFYGAGKIYRVVGREPIDVCVASSSTRVMPNTDMTIYPGDHFAKSSKDVAYGKIGKPQTAVGDGFDLLGAEAA